jgi:hypothetical protein
LGSANIREHSPPVISDFAPDEGEMEEVEGTLFRSIG